VLLVEPIDDTEWVGRRMTMISVFMSPLNVHVNRAPCSGEVVRVKHIAGQFLKAYHKEAPWKNEQTNMVLKCDAGGEILVRQVAGAVARRTVCRVRPGARLERGERYGMIKFSSRVDVYLPEDVDVRVAVGERVYAGQTILAVRPEEAR
jgi:phosphatidylserine decarboxylase